LWAAPAAAQFGFGACTPTAMNTTVRDRMSDIYLWYQHLPNADPARYNTPEEFLEAIRYRELDTSFSYIADRAATEALFSSSQYAGFGFSSTFGPADDLRISQVFPGSALGNSATRMARPRRASAATSWWCGRTLSDACRW
jgi:hypothetical protein